MVSREQHSNDDINGGPRGDGGPLLFVAIAYFVSGLLAWVMIGGLHGGPNFVAIGLWIILGMVMLHRVIFAWNGSRHLGGLNRREKTAFALAAMGLVVGGWGTFGPWTDGHVYHYQELRCADNLRAIGQALRQYSDRYSIYPDRLETLIGTTNLSREALICPRSADRPAAGATTRQVRDDLNRGGHLSFLFAGVRLRSSDVKSQQVIALDRVHNHGWNGSINVLFGDGHVEPYSVERIEGLFSDLNQAIADHP